jgi:hypothetical protein
MVFFPEGKARRDLCENLMSKRFVRVITREAVS